jgi:DNA (cytosine-5)-methyltransferase 1
MEITQKKTTKKQRNLFSCPVGSQHEEFAVKSQHVLNVTREFFMLGNVRVGRHINGFIPESAVGSANKKNGKGTNITLLLSGMDMEFKTDIPCDKKIFRIRKPIKDFVRHHNIRQGDKVYLEKINKRVFRLRPVTKQFTFIDLFAGIGGMRIAFEKAGGKCVFSSEWDKFAQQTYEANFGEKPEGDIRKILSSDIPDHDILVAGFPCQPFSISGVSKKNALGKPHGFDDPTQGTLFFEIKRVLEDKKPAAFLLENVKNLRSHDKGNTYRVIKKTLKDLGYTIFDQVIDADTYVPQHRERIFIVGFREPTSFLFPEHKPSVNPKFRQILEKDVPDKYTLTDHLWKYLQNYAKKHKANGNGFGFGMTDLDGRSRTLSARYYKDGSEVLIPQGKEENPRRLMPKECARLMGFTQLKPDFKIPVSDTQAYKQFGNAVVVPVVYDIAKEMIKELQKETKK